MRYSHEEQFAGHRMARIVPNNSKIKTFRTEIAFERWLSMNHDRETEIWLKIFKKDSGVAGITPAQALDVALCWGWIDGLRKRFDDRSFLQRYSPRRSSEYLESDQSRPCGPTDCRGPDDAAWTAASRHSQG